MLDLRECLRDHGLAADGWQAPTVGELAHVRTPYVAHLNGGHFVVVTSTRHKRLAVFDPLTNTTDCWTAGSLLQQGTGWVVTLSR